MKILNKQPDSSQLYTNILACECERGIKDKTTMCFMPHKKTPKTMKLGFRRLNNCKIMALLQLLSSSGKLYIEALFTNQLGPHSMLIGWMIGAAFNLQHPN